MFKTFVICFLAAMAGIVFSNNVGEVEGSFHPVVGRATLVQATTFPPPAYRTKWSATANKYRDCDFKGIEWFLGPRGGRRVQVRAEFMDRPQVRGQGVLFWDQLVIWLDPQETVENSHADVLHDCGLSWQVRTPFYN